jgi:hypothetical protein
MRSVQTLWAFVNCGRKYIKFETDAEYVRLANERPTVTLAAARLDWMFDLLPKLVRAKTKQFGHDNFCAIDPSRFRGHDRNRKKLMKMAPQELEQERNKRGASRNSV